MSLYDIDNHIKVKKKKIQAWVLKYEVLRKLLGEKTVG